LHEYWDFWFTPFGSSTKGDFFYIYIMSLSIVSITLNIRNNKPYPQRVSVLGSPVNPLDNANATTEYRWDVSSLILSASETLILEYKPIGAGFFSTYTYELTNPNIQSILNALDSLGIGFFNYYTELGQNYFSTFNDNYVFGNLTINPNGTPATTTTTIAPTTTTTTIAPTTTTTTIVGFSYDVSATSSVDAPTACSFVGSTNILFATQSNPLLVTKFFTDSGCTIPYSGDTNFYKYQATGGGGAYSCQIDLGGNVTNAAGCP